MMLTGKAKKMFEGWYLKLPNAIGLNYGAFDITMNRFYCLPESMQWGVYQDWADSMGYEMCVAVSSKEMVYWFEVYEPDGCLHYSSGFKTRQEARTAALQKLNEIINNR